MDHFHIDTEKCISCGQCAANCPVRIISMDDGIPVLVRQKEQFCIGCMHCYAICSEGAVSLFGQTPSPENRFEKDKLPTADQIKHLLGGRRSIRSYQDRNMKADVIQDLLDTAWQAPTGRNVRELLFTVIDDKAVLASVREELLEGIDKQIQDETLGEMYGEFAKFPHVWKEFGYDVLFRGAPHCLIVSAPKDAPTPVQDATIALTTLDLYAQAQGIGTLWNGIAKIAMTDLVPEIRERFYIPEDHDICYVMCFGHPAVRYKQLVSRGLARVQRVE